MLHTVKAQKIGKLRVPMDRMYENNAPELRLPLDFFFPSGLASWISAIFSKTASFSIFSFSSSSASTATISLTAAFWRPRPLTYPSKEFRSSKLPLCVMRPSSSRTTM